MSENWICEYHRGGYRKPIGHLVAVKTDGVVTIGWSLCSKKDRFEKDFGLSLAMRRAEKYNKDDIIKRIPESMWDHLGSFSVRAKKFFKDATDCPVYMRTEEEKGE